MANPLKAVIAARRARFQLVTLRHDPRQENELFGEVL
jgi:hypothetical protein